MSRLDFGPVNDLVLFHNTNTETGNIVIPGFIHTRHLSSFAANKCTFIVFTGFYHAHYDFGSYFGVEFPASQIIQEEKRFGSMTKDIIGTHRKTVYTN